MTQLVFSIANNKKEGRMKEVFQINDPKAQNETKKTWLNAWQAWLPTAPWTWFILGVVVGWLLMAHWR